MPRHPPYPVWVLRGTMGTMVEGTYVPLPERDDVTQVTASRIYRALYWRDWNTALSVIEGGVSRPSPDYTTAVRAALLAMPHSMRSDPRWRRLAPLLGAPRAPVAAAPVPGGVVDPVIELTGTALRQAQAGDLDGALRAVERARAMLDRPEAGGTRARQLELPRAILAWADIVSGSARIADAIVLYARAHALARELGLAQVAIAAASGAAFLQASTGRNAARDEWIAAAMALMDDTGSGAPLPTFLRIALVFRELDRIDIPAARTLHRVPDEPDPYAFDVALRGAQVDCYDAGRDPSLALADLDAAALVAPLDARGAPLRQVALAVTRARLFALSGRVHLARDLVAAQEHSMSSSGAPSVGAEWQAYLAAPRALYELECGNPDGALQHGYLATSTPADARAHALGTAVVAAALVERRHPDAPSACARAVTLADEGDLASGLAMLPRPRLDAVLSFAPAASPSVRRIRAALDEGALRLPPRVAPAPVLLSTHERTVLRHLSTGLSMGRTAMAMRLSVNTVKTHVRHIYRKLGVSNRAELIRAATEHGLL